MLDRQRGRIVFECDGCADTLETGESDFADAKAALDSEGWVAREEPSGSRVWCHYCGTCKILSR